MSEILHTDPVCLMKVPDSSKLNTEYHGKKYYFCSSYCLNTFTSNPQPYLTGSLVKDVESTNFKTYFPLVLIFGYLLGAVFIGELRNDDLDIHRLMANFMGGFFLVFSFFKFLDLRGFAKAFRSYDILAKRSQTYAFAYPFMELGLGISYLLQCVPFYTNLITVVVMTISSIGVVQSLLKKSSIQCACLGTIFNFPMSTVTLIEDVLMLIMAAFGLWI